jgi:tRNA threonylcarbamoyladenosine biosynthesis protein TsaB
MNILVLETTLGGLSLALGRGDGPSFARRTDEPRSSSQLHPLLADLLDEAQVKPDEIHTLGVSIGPGSFTGARVAVAVAEAWGLAQPQCRLVGLQTLPLVAKELGTRNQARGPFRVLTDAAGGMVYGQDFSPTGQALAAAFCVPLAAGLATPLPVVAANLPLVDAALQVGQLSPAALLAGLEDPACHAPLVAVYLKPLAYQERATRPIQHAD